MNIARLMSGAACHMVESFKFNGASRIAFTKPYNTPHSFRPGQMQASITWSTDGNLDNTPLWILFSTTSVRTNVPSVSGVVDAYELVRRWVI